MFRSLAPQVLSGTLLAAALFAGCVEIPSEGHTPPDYKSSIRVMYLDPAITSSTTIMVAEGPDFDPFVSNVFQSGSFGTVTTYSIVNSGAKRMALSFDTDTSAVVITTEQRGTLVVLPRPDASMPRYLLMSEGRTFEAIGVTGMSRVRVLNAIARSGSDTVDVAVDIFRTSDSTSVETGVGFGAFSDYIEVAADSSEGFYLVRAGSTEVLTDAVSVTGASNSDYTIVGSGSSDAASLESFRNE